MTLRVRPALEPLVRVFDDLGIGYSVVGSVASSAHGVPRTTLDVDLVADLPERLVQPLVAAITADYYVDEDAAIDAVRRRSMFNAIHTSTVIKVDVYVLSDRPFDRESFARRAPTRLDPDDDRTFPADTAEDVILHKLEWYRAGGEASERQWNDLVTVMRVQGPALDRAYVDRWASTLGLDDLLARAYRDASR
jgi:hypothetical protein